MSELVKNTIEYRTHSLLLIAAIMLALLMQTLHSTIDNLALTGRWTQLALHATRIMTVGVVAWTIEEVIASVLAGAGRELTS